MKIKTILLVTGVYYTTVITLGHFISSIAGEFVLTFILNIKEQ